MKTFPHKRTQLMMAAGVLWLAGCGGAKDADLVSAGKASLAKNDVKSAVVQLKSALQADASSAEARYLLGKALLQSGDAESAAVELSKARELKFPDDQVLPELAEALMVQGRFKQVIDEFAGRTLSKPLATAELKTSVAMANARLGQFDAATKSINEALAASPKFPSAMLLQAKLMAGKGDADGALALIDSVVASGTMKADAYLLRGDIMIRAKRDTKAAVEAYRKALEGAPDGLLAHVAIISVYMNEKNIPAARAQFAELKKVLPDHPQTWFTEAQIAYLDGDFKKAREVSNQLLQLAPNGARVRQFAGTLDLQQNSLLQAEANLAKAVQLAPEMVVARRLLATTYLRMGQPDKALPVLGPLLAVEKPAVETLALAAEAHLLAGDVLKAETYYTAASKAGSQDANIRTALALTQLAKGKADQAFDTLESVAASDPSDVANMALITARMRRGEMDQAAKAIEQLQHKMPNRPMAPHLMGRLQLLRGDAAAARASFERALKIDPAFFPSVVSLGGLDVAEQKFDQARTRFEGLAKTDPNNVKAKLAVIDLRMRSGQPHQEVVKLLTDLVKEHPAEPAPSMALIALLVNAKDYKQALVTAQEAAARLPENVEILDALGRMQSESGDTQQAVTTFNKLIAMQPKAEWPYLKLSDLYARKKDFPAAMLQLKRALDAAPGSVEAQRRLIALAIQTKDLPQAFAQARGLQKRSPDSALGFVFEGDVHATQKQWKEAVAAYRVAAGKPGDLGRAPAKLHHAMLQAGQTAEADAFATSWTKAHPQDWEFRIHLGDNDMVAGKAALAEKHYLEVLKLQPSNVSALNNMAWIWTQRGQKGAVGFAEKAAIVSPGNASVLDTLALALVSEGQLDRAIQTQRQAVMLAPSDYAMAVRLSSIYAKAGKKTEALAELSKVEKAGAKYSGQAEVAKLKASLGG